MQPSGVTCVTVNATAPTLCLEYLQDVHEEM